MSDDYEIWLSEAEQAARKSSTSLPAAHILETMYDDGCEPEAAADEAILARYVRAPARRHETRNDVGPILAEHRRHDI